MNKKTKRKDLCVYCGEYKYITADHIPPKNLFAKPRPQNLITVPSCFDCNEGAANDDEYLRMILSLRDDIADHETLQKLQPKIKRSLTRPEFGGLRKLFFDSVHPTSLRTQSGLYLGKIALIEPDSKKINRVITRIAKGLYYVEKNKVLPQDFNIIWFRYEKCQTLTAEDIQTLKQMLAHLQTIELNIIGNNDFSYRFLFAEEDDRYFTGAITFYGEVTFFISSIDKETAIRHNRLNPIYSE